MTNAVFNGSTKSEVSSFVNRPLLESFSTTGNFDVIRKAALRLSSHEGVPEPCDISSALGLVFTACVHHGQVAFIIDYLREICANPKITSSDVSECAVLDGTLAQIWLENTVSNAVSALKNFKVEDVQSCGSLHCSLQSAQVVNVAIQSAGLSASTLGVSPGIERPLLKTCSYADFRS